MSLCICGCTIDSPSVFGCFVSSVWSVAWQLSLGDWSSVGWPSDSSRGNLAYSVHLLLV